MLEWFVCKNWQFVQNRWENIPHLQFFVKNAAMYTFCLGEIKSFRNLACVKHLTNSSSTPFRWFTGNKICIQSGRFNSSYSQDNQVVQQWIDLNYLQMDACFQNDIKTRHSMYFFCIWALFRPGGSPIFTDLCPFFWPRGLTAEFSFTLNFCFLAQKSAIWNGQIFSQRRI